MMVGVTKIIRFFFAFCEASLRNKAADQRQISDDWDAILGVGDSGRSS